MVNFGHLLSKSAFKVGLGPNVQHLESGFYCIGSFHSCVMFADEAKVTDVLLKLDVDFDRHVLDGSVTLTVEKVKPEATHVVSL